MGRFPSSKYPSIREELGVGPLINIKFILCLQHNLLPVLHRCIQFEYIAKEVVNGHALVLSEIMALSWQMHVANIIFGSVETVDALQEWILHLWNR